MWERVRQWLVVAREEDSSKHFFDTSPTAYRRPCARSDQRRRLGLARAVTQILEYRLGTGRRNGYVRRCPSSVWTARRASSARPTPRRAGRSAMGTVAGPDVLNEPFQIGAMNPRWVPRGG